LLPSLLIVRAIPGGGIPTTIAVVVTKPGSPGESRDTLIQVVIEVRSGTSRFRVSVRVEPESFFLGDDFDGAEQDMFQMPKRLVG
jgi:hypothetical protein